MRFSRRFHAPTIFSTLLLSATLAVSDTKPTPAAGKTSRARKPSPTATPTPSGEVKAWDVQPKAPYRVGDLVTVVGSGLDQVVSVLLAGSFSADIATSGWSSRYSWTLVVPHLAAPITITVGSMRRGYASRR